MKSLPVFAWSIPSTDWPVELLALGAAVVGEARALREWSRELRCAAGARRSSRCLRSIRGGSGLDGRRTSSAERQHPRLDGLSMMVVEDDADAREMLAELLRSAGALVTTASTARMAWLLLQHMTPTAVVTDLAMPGESGVWLLQRLREHPRWRRIPVIAFTGRYHTFTARAAGFDALLRKPDDLDRLCVTIARLVERAAA